MDESKRGCVKIGTPSLHRHMNDSLWFSGFIYNGQKLINQNSTFMEATILLITTLELGLCLLIIISMFIYCIYDSFKENSISYFFGGILWILIFGSIPTWGAYIIVNKYCSKPMLTNETEVYINGENRIQYQDTTHLCHPSDKNSTMFTSYLSPNGEVSQKDTCIFCLRPFLAHDTQAEHRYYEAMSYMSESMNYCCNFNDVNSIETSTKCSYETNGFMVCENNTEKISWYNKKAFCTFAPQKQFSICTNNNRLP